MSTLNSFFRKLTRCPERRISALALAVGALAVAVCFSLSPQIASAQCQSGDAKFIVNVVQLVPTEKTIADGMSLLKATRQKIDQQVGLLQPSEVRSRIAALNKAFKPAAICFESDGQVKAIPFDQLHLSNSLSSYHTNDSLLSQYYPKFTAGNSVLRFLIVPDMAGFNVNNSIAAECPRLNINVSQTGIPGWKYYPDAPDICFIRRIVFSDPEGVLNNDYAIVHETAHWLGLGEAFDRNSLKLTEEALNEAKQRMRFEESAEAECKKLNPAPSIGYDGSTDTPVQQVPAGCDVAYSCTRGSDGHLKKVPRGNPMDYGFAQAGCELSSFSPGQIAILKKGAQYRQKH